MKHLILFLFLSFGLQAQEVQKKIRVFNQYHDDEVYLRWMPSDVATWDDGVSNGYTITRFTKSIDGVPLTEAQIDASKTIIGQNLKPIIESQWNNNNFSNPNRAAAVKHLLYNDEYDVSFTPSDLQQVVDLNNTKKNKITFLAMLADQDFELAASIGVGIKDANLNDFAKYSYHISLSTSPDVYLDDTHIDLNKVEDFLAIKDIETVGADKVVLLEWKIQKATKQYASYNIERSVDGVNFELVNEEPFIYSRDKSVTNYTDRIIFKDSIPQNEVDYYYRINGNSPFGLQGPYCKPIIGRGVPGRMDISLLAAFGLEDADQVIVKWGGIDQDQLQYVDKIEVYRSKYVDGGYVNISGTSISPSQTQFVDNDPLYSGYYVVTMIDIHGHYYKSRAIFAQPSDDVPPAIPSGISATADKNGKVDISWSANDEEDLEGYRIFRSNLRNGNFVDIGNEDLTETEYTDYLTTDMLTDSIFYALKSSDIRGNHSEFSDIIALGRPNDIPPSAPVLYNLVPTQEGVKVSWVLSPSSDVVFHILQRKPKNRAGWDEVAMIENGSELSTQQFGDDLLKYNYIDQSELDQVVYQYRILAADAYENQSLSNMMEITPLFSNIEGEIHNFTGTPICEFEGNSELSNQISSLEAVAQSIANSPSSGTGQLLDLVSQGVITYNQYASLLNNVNGLSSALNGQIQALEGELGKLKCKVLLECLYKSEAEIEYLELYRSDSNASPELYRTYRVDQLIIHPNLEYQVALIDDDVELGNRYNYKLMIFIKGGVYTSPLSDEITILIEE